MTTDSDVRVTLSLDDDVSPAVQRLQADLARLQRLTRRLKAPAASSFLPSPKVARAAGLQLGQDLRQRLLFGQRMQRQQQRQQRDEDRAAKTAESRALAGFKAQMAFAARMSSQRASEERQRESAHRTEMRRLDRENAAHARMWRDRRRRALDGIGSTSRGAAVAAGIGTAGAAVAGHRVLGTESNVDGAEISARIYGGLTKQAARALRTQWAVPRGIDLGVRPADMMMGYTEALKASIPKDFADDFAELIFKTSKAWEVDAKEAADALSLQNALITGGGGRFDFGKLKTSANAIQALAGKMETTPARMIEFQRQGAGAAKLLGMSPEMGLAFGAASTSLGNRPGESGSMMDFLAGRIIDLPRLSKQNGEEGRQAKALVRALGYGSAENMNRQRRANPDEFLFDMFDRMNRIANPKKRDEAMKALFLTEWLGEGSRLVEGTAKLRQAQRIAAESRKTDAVEEAFKLYQERLSFLADQIANGWDGVIGELGMAMSPYAHDLGRFFVGLERDLIASGRLRRSVESLFTGLTHGFLGRAGSFRELLDSLSASLTGSFDPEAFYRFGRGAAEGIMAVGSALKSGLNGLAWLLNMDPSKAETMGKLAAGIGALSLAFFAVGPAIGVIWGLTAAIGALGAAAAAAAAWTSGKGAAAGTAGAAGAAGATGGFSRVMRLLGLGGAAAGPALFGGTRVQPFTADQLKALGLGPDGSKLPAAGEKEHVRDLFGIDGHRFGAGYQGLGTLESMDTTLKAIRGDLALGGLADKASKGLAGFGYGVGETSIGGYGGASRGGQLPNGMSVSDLTGASAIGGGKGLLDAIARAEGTAGRGDYETVLGYGKYGSPSKPLTQMTLAEAFAFGRTVKAKHGSSSAIGRYQIVGNTMKDAARALGMDMNTTRFDASTQDRMAEWIARNQGLGAWEGFRRNPAELATARAAMAGAPTISGGAAVRYANAQATRNKKVTDSLQASLSEAVASVYGPGFTAEIYSGGQDAKGKGGRRTGSTRHDDHGHGGKAADVYVLGPNGQRLRGDQLGPIAQWWLAQGKGGVGLEMNGGGIHLDEHRDRAKTWTYGPLTPGQRSAVNAGLAGVVPPSAQGLAAGVQTSTAISSKVPTPSQRPAQGSGGTTSGPISVVINGSQLSPDELLNTVTRRLRETMNHALHDVYHGR